MTKEALKIKNPMLELMTEERLSKERPDVGLHYRWLINDVIEIKKLPTSEAEDMIKLNSFLDGLLEACERLGFFDVPLPPIDPRFRVLFRLLHLSMITAYDMDQDNTVDLLKLKELFSKMERAKQQILNNQFPTEE